MMIDANLAQLVDDDGDPAAVIRRQYAIKKGSFARAQKSRDDNHRRFF